MFKKIKNLINIPRSIYHYRKGHLLLPYLPNALWVEPTNICNLRCVMCPNSIFAKENAGFMDMRLYQKIINEAKGFISYIILCLAGESLLHKNFPEMVKIAKDNGISTYVSTNCTSLSPDLSRKILKSGLDWINFSFDGCTKETYEKIRVNANFEKTLQNIVDFLKIKKELNAKTFAEMQILVMDKQGLRDYQENIDMFLSYFVGLPLDYIQVREPSSWGGFFKNTKRFKPKALGNKFSPCSYLWSSLHILWDGRIVACTSDFFGANVLGRFSEKSLKEIWNDKPMQNFRKAMINEEYLSFNKDCCDCDSLWERRILGLPPGIRGISATTLNNVFGKNFFKSFKKIAKFLNPDFGIEVVRKEI